MALRDHGRSAVLRDAHRIPIPKHKRVAQMRPGFMPKVPSAPKGQMPKTNLGD